MLWGMEEKRVPVGTTAGEGKERVKQSERKRKKGIEKGPCLI